MAIRMKEWGMLAPAPQQLDRSGQKRALLDNVEVAQRRERSVQDLASGTADFIRDEGNRQEKREQEEEDALLAEVERTGELAGFMNSLEEANRLSQEEMQDLGADQDMEYAWKQRATPHFKAAIDKLSPAARAAGEQIAARYNERSYISTKQQLKLARIAKARNSWNESLQSSIDRGDEVEATSWIDSVVDIFIPRDSVEEAKKSAQSAARYRHWDEQFKSAPIQTLSVYKKTKDAEFQLSEEHREELTQLSEETERGARSALAEHLSRQILADKPIKPASLQQVEDAGLLTKNQIARLNYKTAKNSISAARDFCEWQGRIDRCGDDQADLLELKLQLATAPLNSSDKKKLFLRLDQSQSISASKRQRMNTSIWNAYRRGELGTMGDRHSLARLRQIQDLAPKLVEEDGLDKLDELISKHSIPEQVWVCLDDRVLDIK